MTRLATTFLVFGIAVASTTASATPPHQQTNDDVPCHIESIYERGGTFIYESNGEDDSEEDDGADEADDSDDGDD